MILPLHAHRSTLFHVHPGPVMLYLSRRHLLPRRRRVLLQQCLKSSSKQWRTKQDCVLRDNSMHIRGAFQTPWQRTVEAWWTDSGKANIIWCEPLTTGHCRHVFSFIFSGIFLGTLKQMSSFCFQTDPGNWALLDQSTIRNKNTANLSLPDNSFIFFVHVCRAH